jgi:alpha-L-fucosidase
MENKTLTNFRHYEMQRFLFLMMILCASGITASAQQSMPAIMPVPSRTPSPGQQQQIARKYGMFLHFGMNTFHDMEWTDGTKPAESYAPTAIDAEQWVLTARDAGMRYVILVAKHHDGFCLWDSRVTRYDVAESGNTTNVVEALAKACQKYGIGLGLYYSLWDRNRNADVENPASDSIYNAYIIAQVAELISNTSKYTPLVEFWFDGTWEKPNSRWPVAEIYREIKSREPLCQVGINWSIGAPGNSDEHMMLPENQKEGYPIRYFPSDFRLGDPYLPAANDPKVFSHYGQFYYMPWESTLCLSQRWFYNTTDTVYRDVGELVKLYQVATANDNILILNCPPGRNGRIRETDRQLLMRLRERIVALPEEK